MHRRGHRQRHDVERRQNGDGVERQPHPAERAEPGALFDCPACDTSFTIPALASASPSPDLHAGAAHLVPTHPSEVNAAWSAGLGLALACLFYGAVVWPLRESYFGELFTARGWVPYAITFFAAWSFVILAAKLAMLRRQMRSLSLDALPRSLGETIDRTNLPVFDDYAANLARAHADSLLLTRVSGALRQFRSRPVDQIATNLANQAEADALAVEGSYALVRVFVWAIPIFGFIGTVIGIGAAVSGFSDSVAAAVDLAVMQESIGSVTTGLGVAFDTTLLALVVSVLIMLPASALQKAEEDIVLRIDRYCRDHLLTRLRVEHASAAPPEAPKLHDAIAELGAAVRALERKLEDR